MIEITGKNKTDYPTMRKFAKDYDVSEQTIKNDIREINYILRKKNQPPVTVDNEGRVKSSMLLDLSFFNNADFYSYKLSPGERKTVLAMMLLTMDRYTTIAELSERVKVSRNTLISDLDELKVWFQENGLSLLPQPRKGLLVISDERNIRKGQIKLLQLNNVIYDSEEKLDNDIFHTLLLHELGGGEKLKNIKTILKNTEDTHGIYLTDFSFREVSYFLLVLVNRIEKGKHVGGLNFEQWNDIRRSSKYELAETLLMELCERYDLSPHHEELALIVEQLRGGSYIKNQATSKDTDMIDIQILINEFIYKLSKEYKIHYYLNFYLYDLLLAHMKTVAYRIKQNRVLSSPLADQLEEEYADMFLVVEKHLRPLKEYLRASISRDEISFIVMYLLAILEKNKANDMPINTLLICNSGRGSAQLILAKVSSLFKQIMIKDVLSSHRLMSAQIQDIDLILSTVPVDEPGMPVVQVSQLLKEADIDRIQRVIMQIQRKKCRSQSQQTAPAEHVERSENLSALMKEGKALCELLSEGNVLLDANALDWREAVELAGEILFRNGIAEKRYTRNMIRNIEENGPYVVIYPGIAIPHAQHSDGSLREGASIVRLSRPVYFNHKENDPVKFVIAFSVIDSGSIGRALYNLTRIFATGSFLEQLEKAEDNVALINTIMQYESRIDVAWRWVN